MCNWFTVSLPPSLNVSVFNYISAHVNPASVLALLILDEVDGQTFVALAASQFAGAFLGAILVWLSFLPHFKTIPEPPSKSEDDLLLRSRDYMTPEALSIASYNTRGEDVKRRNRGAKVILAGAVKDVRYFLSQSDVHPEDHDELLKVAFGGASGLYEKEPSVDEEHGDGKWETKDPRGPLRRRSVQVADVHRRLKDMDLVEFQQMLRVPEVGAGKPVDPTDYPNEVSVDVPPNAVKRSNSISTRELEQIRGREEEGSKEKEVEKPSRGAQRSRPSLVEHTLKFLDHPPEPKTELEKPKPSGKTARALAEHMSPTERLLEARRARSDALFRAAIVADQNAKLSIFCTRPAIWSPFVNALCEFMCTVALILLYLLLVERGNQLYEPVRGLWKAMTGIWAGFLIFVLILGMGGPTGIAANPARDLGPRIAHFVLPIPGKRVVKPTHCLGKANDYCLGKTFSSTVPCCCL